MLVDLDLQFGDVALSLGLAPQGTVYDLATAGGSPSHAARLASAVPVRP